VQTWERGQSRISHFDQNDKMRNAGPTPFQVTTPFQVSDVAIAVGVVEKLCAVKVCVFFKQRLDDATNVNNFLYSSPNQSIGYAIGILSKLVI
jgi:hypothetical protein